MADLTITPANVENLSPGSSETTGVSGAVLTAGDLVYLDPADSTYKKADANTEALAVIAGVCLNSVEAAGQPITVQTGGQMDLGATLTVGQIYAASANAAGAIAPYADLATGDFVSILGVASAADAIDLAINNTGIAKP